MVEATLALATIAGRRRLRHLPDRTERKQRPGITMGPRSLVMVCEPRTAGDHVVDNA
jgi:pentalenene oxygenase